MDKYDLYYQVAHSHLVEQDTRNQQLEFKASGAIAVSATLMGLAGLTVEHWGSLSQFPAFFMLLAFIVTASSTMPILWTKAFSRRPQLAILSGHLRDPQFGDNGLTDWVADEFTTSIKHNDDLLSSKAKWFRVSLSGLVAEGIALGVLILSTDPSAALRSG